MSSKHPLQNDRLPYRQCCTPKNLVFSGNQHHLIVGGGLAGLCLALTLSRKGLWFEICDSSSTLEHMARDLSPAANTLALLECLNPYLHPLCDGLSIAHVANDSNCVTNYAPVKNLLREVSREIPTAAIHLNKMVESAAVDGKFVRLLFTDGTTIWTSRILCGDLNQYDGWVRKSSSTALFTATAKAHGSSASPEISRFPDYTRYPLGEYRCSKKDVLSPMMVEHSYVSPFKNSATTATPKKTWLCSADDCLKHTESVDQDQEDWVLIGEHQITDYMKSIRSRPDLA